VKKALLRMDITERVVGIFFVLGVDMGDCPFIKMDLDLVPEPGKLKLPRPLRLPGIKVKYRDGGNNKDNYNKRCQ